MLKTPRVPSRPLARHPQGPVRSEALTWQSLGESFDTPVQRDRVCPTAILELLVAEIAPGADARGLLSPVIQEAVDSIAYALQLRIPVLCHPTGSAGP